MANKKKKKKDSSLSFVPLQQNISSTPPCNLVISITTTVRGRTNMPVFCDQKLTINAII